MKNFKNFIAEKHIQYLYHTTPASNAGNILHAGIKSSIIRNPSVDFDSALLLKALKMDKDQLRAYLKRRGYERWISFARHPVNGYTRYILEDFEDICIFKINASKISKYGKIIPVDYSASDNPDIVIKHRSEQEERLLTSYEYVDISNAVEHVIGIYPSNDSNREQYYKDIEERFKVPVTTFKYSGDPRRAIDKYRKDLGKLV